MSLYYWAMIKTKLIATEDSIVLDTPFTTYFEYIMDGNRSVTYSGRVKGRSVIALIAVKSKDKEALQKWIGYIGDKWDEVKVKTEYKDVYTIKIKDVKRTIDKDAKVTEYEGIDKDEPHKFSEWCEEPKEVIDVVR